MEKKILTADGSHVIRLRTGAVTSTTRCQPHRRYCCSPGGCWHSLEFSGSCCLLAARRWALRLRQLWPLPGAGTEPSGPLNQGYDAWEVMKQGRSTGLGSGPHQIPVFPLLVVTWWASLGTPLGLLCPSGHRGFKESPSAVGPAAPCILRHPGHRSLKFPSHTSER